MRIAITTPTGHIGSALTEKLLDEGQEVTLLARDPSKVERFLKRGAKVAQGSLADRYFVIGATSGAEALFWLTPPDLGVPDLRRYQSELGRVAAEAVKANRIPRVVNLSSVGAHLGQGAGPINGLHDVERSLDDAALNVTHLRPVSFMENVLNSVGTIKQTGCIFLPVSGRTKVPLVATRDIAQVAATRLLDQRWSGRHALRIQGPDDLTFDGVAQVLSKVLGRPVNHVQVTSQQASEAMKGMGISQDVAAQFVEMYGAFDSGRIESGKPGEEKVTTATTFERFTEEVVKPAIGE